MMVAEHTQIVLFLSSLRGSGRGRHYGQRRDNDNHHKCITVEDEGQLYSQKIAGEVEGGMTRTPSESKRGRFTSGTNMHKEHNRRK